MLLILTNSHNLMSLNVLRPSDVSDHSNTEGRKSKERDLLFSQNLTLQNVTET